MLDPRIERLRNDMSRLFEEHPAGFDAQLWFPLL